MGDLTQGTSAPAPAPSWRTVVACVTLVQAVLALMSRTLPLFGVPLTAMAGMPPEAVGQFSSATSLGSMIFFLWGPGIFLGTSSMRQLQAGCLVAGLAVLLCLPGQWWLMVLGAFVIGLGYGPGAPAGSDILMRIVPRERRSMIFSIKQAGVPMGGFIAGFLLPAIAVATGAVAPAIATAAGLAIISALMLGFWRVSLDPAHPRVPGSARIRLATLALAPLRSLLLLVATPALRLTTLAGFALGIAQGVVMSYFPTFLNSYVGWSFVAAGAIFGLLQGLGIFGRVAMGWLADRIGSPIRAMVWLCILSGITMMLLATFSPQSPTIWIVFVSALAGVTVISWNGVFLTGLAEAAPEGRVGEITGAGTFILFSGYVVCPLVMQWIFHITGGYAGGLIVAGLAPLLAGLALRRVAS